MRFRFRNWFCLSASAIALISCSSEAEFGGSKAKSYDQVASRVFNFKSSNIVPQTLTVSDGGRFTSLDITQLERAPSQVLQKQIKRQAFSETFVQGHAARYSEEEFQLSEAGMLDFLVVVDNSRSMGDERDMVGRGLAPLISAFNDTNWQIAVISMSNPCVDSSNLIKKTDANPASKFADAVRKSVDWQATEQGFPMAIRALKGQCGNSTRPWLRANSSVGILFVSDEDNCGSDAGERDRCANIEGKNADEMVNALRVVRPAEQGRMYAIIDKDGSCPDAGGIGSMYNDALAKTGGSAGSICRDYSSTSGYGEYLSSVSKDVSRIVKRQFRLSFSPDMAQFSVQVDGKAVSGGIVSVNGNVVTIDPAAFSAGSKIKFSYSHDAIPMFTEIPIKAAPSLDTLKIMVNGRVLQPQVDYQYNAQRKVITFTQMPPEDATVLASYLEDKVLLTNFPVDMTGARSDTVKVSVNGVVQAGDVYSFDDSGVDFRNPPADGAIVSIAWRTEAHKVRDYNAKITDPRQPVAWHVVDKVSGVQVPATWNGSVINFEYAQVIEGRVIAFTVDFGEKSQLRTLNLPSERIDDEIKILADGREGVCSVSGTPADLSEQDVSSASDEDNLEAEKKQNWEKRYKGRTVSLQCEPGVDYAVLQVQYLHELERTGSFDVKLPLGTNPDDPMIGWRVFVDGVLNSNFVRSGSLITLDPESLPPETRVDVEVLTYSPAEK